MTDFKEGVPFGLPPSVSSLEKARCELGQESLLIYRDHTPLNKNKQMLPLELFYD